MIMAKNNSIHKTRGSSRMYAVPKRHFLRLLFLVTFALCTYGADAESGVVSMVELENCVQSTDSFKCEKKMIVGASVSYGNPTIFDAVTIKEVMVDGEPQTLEETVRLEITKSLPKVPYPFHKEFWITVKVTNESSEHTFQISPEMHIYNSEEDALYPGNFHMKAELIGDLPAYSRKDQVKKVFSNRVLLQPGEKEIPSLSASLVSLTIVAEKLRIWTTESPGFIVDARIEPCPTHECPLEVRIRNDGDLTASYRITVSDASWGFAMVPEQDVTLEAQAEKDLTFKILRLPPYELTGTTKAYVRMFSQAGKFHGKIEVVWDLLPVD